MTEDNRRLASGHELRLGSSALDAACLLREAGLYGDALSRLYYALFHHVVAALLTQGVEPRRHAALPGLVGQHLVPAGAMSQHDIGTLGRVASQRHLADYEREWEVDAATLDLAFDEVEALLARLRAWLDDEGWS